MAQTLYDKIWRAHRVCEDGRGQTLLFIDRHLIHEVTSPQAFEGLRLAGRRVRHPELTLAVPEHNVPTEGRAQGVKNEASRIQIETLVENCRAFHIPLIDMLDVRQGIVHVIGPEQGFTLPGSTIVCGDSHTATHGAFGALAFGIGTSEIEHVLATQTLLQRPSLNMRVRIEGDLAMGVTSKDLILALIGQIGTAGGTGCVIEYDGPAIRALSMEARMTLCNMSIEGGARAGLVVPDAKTYAYLEGRPLAPKGEAWERAMHAWSDLVSDPGAVYDREVTLEAASVPPQVTWGTSPEDVVPIHGRVPDPALEANADKRRAMQRSLAYMGLQVGQAMTEIAVDRVFIGSCTNGRIEDLRQVARVANGRRVAPSVRAMIVPGSGLVRQQAEQEGLAAIFQKAGFEWREPGCSMCLAMNGDELRDKERCASTSNRNFEGRQGRGGRTHLMSPAMAALAALEGRLADIRDHLS